MSLQLILGSSGAGKSYQLYQEMIRKSMINEDTNYIVIVPEQFTMQTQKDLVSMHPNKGIMNIDILSFLRLAYRIFDEVGGHEKSILEDTGKTMILRKVIEEKKNDLKVFGANVKKQGFIGELKSLLSEILQYSITSEQLDQMVEVTKNKPLLQTKLKDVRLLYDGFKESMSEKYITAEEILDLLVSVIDESKIIRNSVICFDGFTGFTPSQYKLLRHLMNLSKMVLVTVTIDPRENPDVVDEDFKLFHLSKKTITKLLEIAKEEDVKIEEHIYANQSNNHRELVPYRFLNSTPLASLERNLFRYPYKVYEEEQDDIAIHAVKDPLSEVQFVGKEIVRLVREEGYRYKDIAVITGDIEGYSEIVEREFVTSKIPCFIDHKKGILSNPMVELIMSSLEIITKDFSYESVFRFLRCGLLDIEKEEIDQLENYVIALGIRGFKRWNSVWERKYKTKTEIDFTTLNETREKIITPFETMRDVLQKKDSTVLDVTRALYEFLVYHQVALKLEQYREYFETNLMPLEAKEYKQMYRIVMDLFDQLVDLLGNEVLSIKEYSDILKSGLEEAKVGLIPPGTDQIVVGDIERTRLKDIKVLFLIGANEGLIPKSKLSGGIISDIERELLESNHFELAPTRRQSSYISQFYLYLNLTKPQNKLFVTFSKVSSDGKSLRPSSILSKVRSLFPKLKIVDEDSKVKDYNDILGLKGGMEYLVAGLREYRYKDMPQEWRELFSWYFKREDFKEELIRYIDAAFYQNDETSIGKAVSRVLYGNELINSISRLEKYAACAFAHFINYGLELKERQEYKLMVPDIGNIFHNAIELFSSRLEKSEYNWHTITDEVRDAYVSDCVNEAALEYGNAILKSSKRNEYMINRVERITKRTIWALCEHIKQGEFEPTGFELKFSYLDNLKSVNLSLSDNDNMRLQGRIDRLDTYEDDEHLYVKVIDYKSGSTTFDILSLYYGLQLQLVVYMNASIELMQKKYPTKEIIPAGIFYYNLDDPIVDKVVVNDSNMNDILMEVMESEEDTNENQIRKLLIQKNILKELRMNGIVNSDMDIVKLMDKNFALQSGETAPSRKSDIIPVETNKDGTPNKRSNIADKEKFHSMSDYANQKMTELGKQILEGSTEINPYKMGNKTACDYCSYSSICGFDLKLPGNKYRNLKKFSKEEVWDKLEESAGDLENSEDELTAVVEEAEEKKVAGKDSRTKQRKED
ncbi:helicase-exonuclease AddAB subunit AddB [Anaeromicropila herbilytica]|uniref:ATP-dependent helicase/deoxyribonuclease subunit B n=1 Tax=Anaeromicropila herbilytica TaxID=2785025 RepID=A0A7R7IE16_9FIRM|nr:helicase-exonuclease AddAB subunit AddB [Anaeromicropila herbilytica]BCN32152.1 ATP-dependent helicase/deoxyribonuclease subunit B [Anaeromicropila herbilytica]